MKKHYIKMNNNKNYLSFGNIVSIIKEVSNNKNAMQMEVFSCVFDVNDVNVTTINNYCIGIRAIGLEYKKIFTDKYNLFKKDKNIFINNVLSILNLLDDKIYLEDNNSLEIINNNDKLNLVILKLIDICKNDENINQEFINNLNQKSNYEKFIELLNYAININKQPIYTQDINIKINKNELDEYLKLKLYFGQSYISSLINLANKNNMYACADVGALYFDGLIDGEVDYVKSYEYYMKAALKNHPKAVWMIANLILTNRVKYDEDTMWKYLHKSIELGSAAGYNTLGLCYLKGINPDNKIDLKLAKHYFEISSELGYVYAINNIGKMYENENNIDESIKYYKISADMMESWALNKVGEYYRLKGDLKTAYLYYSKSIECPLNERNRYAYYNLAEYYYKNGFKELNIKKDNNKYKEYIDMFNKLKK